MNTTMLRVAAVTATLLGLSAPALAQFSGVYDPAIPGTWATSHFLPGTTDLGSVDTSSAPGSITLVGPDTGSGDFSRLEFTIVAPAAGQVSFSWSYVSNDNTVDPLWDPAGYRYGAGPAQLTQLSVDAGTVSQSGSVSFNVTAGQTFGFYVTSLDNTGGYATLTISNFTAPIPEPASVAMMSLGLLGVAAAAARRRRSN